MSGGGGGGVSLARALGGKSERQDLGGEIAMCAPYARTRGGHEGRTLA
jgi:hypothetical protein